MELDGEEKNAKDVGDVGDDDDDDDDDDVELKVHASTLSFGKTLFYHDSDAAVLSSSSHAEELGNVRVSMVDLSSLQADLQSLVWRLF